MQMLTECTLIPLFLNSVSLEGSNGGKEGRIRPHRGGRRKVPRAAFPNPARCLPESGTLLARPVFAECFKDLGLPEISAARFCRVFQGFAAPALHRRSPEARFWIVFQGFGPPGDFRGPFLQSVSKDLGPRRSPRPPLRRKSKT